MSDEALTCCVKGLSAVFIFGGDIKRADDSSGLGGLGYRSLRGLEGDKIGPMPSYERVLAGAALYRINPKLVLITSGGKSNLRGAPKDAPRIAKVMAAELRAEGVPAGSIIEEEVSFDTQEQFINCSAIARERCWHGTEIGILTVFWHFGRIGAMMMRIQAGNSLRIEPLALSETRFISVERVLASEDEERWKTYFTKLYEHPDMIKTFAKEAAGSGQLLTGHAPAYGKAYRGFRDPLGL